LEFHKKKRIEENAQVHGTPYEGVIWVWTAVDPNTRLLLAYHVGGHELDDCRAILQNLLSRLNDRLPLFVTDELVHYSTVLFEAFHIDTVVPPTGKRGRPRKPTQEVDPRLNYATVKKTRKKGHLIKVTRSIVFGTEQSIRPYLEKSCSNTINTAYIERTNLNWRTWDAHLTRKTLKFARNIDYFKAKLAISIFKYNFVRPHITLTKLAKNVPTTPAMSAKLTDHAWKFEELLEKTYCQ
jgi:IS1 family transposase